MTNVRSADYAWITVDDPYLLDEGFCLSVFSPATVDDVLAGLPAVTESSTGDLGALCDLAWDNGRDLIGGVLQVGESVVLYEPYGYLDDDAKQSLSTGRVAVSVDGNLAASHFRFYRDGASVTMFEHMFATSRQGDDPDAVLPLMEEVGGFDLDRGPEDDPALDANYLASSFALCEAITGARLTYRLMSESQFLICRFA
jgi:hypothetical protein